MIGEISSFVENPLVSIIVITYNQEAYICEALNSILSQQCNFEFEIIIGEDFSTDNTRKICLEYQEKYPEKINLLLQEKNKGVITNYIESIKLCRGRYIAQCAGDDYWCDNLKLQKQIDFLNVNQDYGFVRTAYFGLIDTKGKLTKQAAHSPAVGNVFDIAKYGTIASAPTVCFKRELLNHVDFNEFIVRKFSMEDYPMQAIMAKHTKFGFIPDYTAVYRLINGSVSKPVDRGKIMYYNEGYVAVQRYLSELFPGETDFEENTARNFLLHKRLKFAFEDFDFTEARRLANQFTAPNHKERRLINFVNNRLIFLLGCVYKRAISYRP